MPDSLISIVLPVYNVASFVERCINSILDQTYRNFEIVLVDDCSTDNSPAVITNCLQKRNFTNYQLINLPVNGGAAVARNIGIDAAKGQYLYFIDNDDFAEPSLLESLLEPFTADSEIDIVLCNFYRYYTDTSRREVGFTSPFRGVTAPTAALKAIFNDQEHAYVWRSLYRRACFSATRFPEGVTVEDMLTVPLLWAGARKLYFIPETLYNYVVWSGSVMNNWKSAERWYNIPEHMLRNELLFKRHPDLSKLYKEILVYHYTMLRNYALQLSSRPEGFLQVKPYLENYRNHIRLKGLLKILSGNSLQLVTQLLVLKAGTRFFWKKFSSGSQL